MAITDEQKAALEGPLNRANVKQRTQAGRTLDYVEGWHAIAEANRIFGFDEWWRETVDMREVRQPELVDGKWRVGYLAKVRVQALGVIREGTGYGSGIAKDLGDAIESAIKEAETDAMKRALMTFGNPFGLALYDKTQASVADLPQRLNKTDDRALFERLQAALRKCETPSQYDEFWQHEKTIAARKTLPEDWERDLIKMAGEHVETLTDKAA